MKTREPVLFIVTGPTASGKTDYAIQLAQYFQTEILSADSRQIYKELTIGTAKPTTEQLAQVPHHFISHCSIHDEYNAGMFELEAINKLDSIFQERNYAVLAGGTGLYIKAVSQGLDALPKANLLLRSELELEFQQYGAQKIFNRLENMDLEGSKTIDSQNPQRIMRAIELIHETGKRLSELKVNTIKQRPFKIVNICMDIERKILYERIDQRTMNMMESGLLDEVQLLYKFKNLNALKTVGYQELFEYLDNKLTLENAIEKIKQHTRNYAKRQITWFKSLENPVSHLIFQPEYYL